MRHWKTYMCMMMCLAAVLLTGCKDNEEPGMDSYPASLRMYIYSPDYNTSTRATEGDISSDKSQEDDIHTLQVWVFNHTTGARIAYYEETEVVLDGEAKEVSIPLEELANATNAQIATWASNNTHADVYVLINKGSLGLAYTKETTLATLATTNLSGSQFGVSASYTDDAMVKEPGSNGLPMSGLLTNAEITKVGKIFHIEQIAVKRAVSKLRFVFARSLGMSEAQITGITLNGSQIPVNEKLFTETPETPTGNISGGYVSTAVSYGALTADDIAVNGDPLALVWRSDEGITPQAYENRVNAAIGNGTATEYGRTYLRESDKKLSGTITYKLTSSSVEKSVDFTMDTEGDFARNHSWIVYGYFLNADLKLTVTTNSWDLWTESVNYRDEVSVDEIINFEAETVDGQQRIYDGAVYQYTVVTMKPGEVAVCHFAFNTPAQGTWVATLEATEGDNLRAIVFDDGTPEGTLTMSGSIGPRATLRIKVTNPSPSMRYQARLHFAVRNQSGSHTFDVKKDVIGSEIIMSQPIN